MKFGKLIPREIIKIVATRCHILKLKRTIFHFGLARAVPQNPLRELTALPRSLTGFKRSILLREGRGGKTGGNGKGEEKWGEDLLLRRGKREGERGRGRLSPKPKNQTSPMHSIICHSCNFSACDRASCSVVVMCAEDGLQLQR